MPERPEPPEPQIAKRAAAPALLGSGAVLLVLALGLVTFFQVLPAIIALGASFFLLFYGFAAAVAGRRPSEEPPPPGTSAVRRTESPARGRLMEGLTWAACGALAVLVSYAGILQVVGVGFVRQLYARWHYPTELRWAVGGLEVALSAALLVPRLATIAALALVPIMLGATYTLLAGRYPAVASLPIALSFLLCFVAWERSATHRKLRSHGGTGAR
ncbi:MAG TPA: DoxX family protein [Polyangiaceae bacterium]|nr:DoxX family protein [Polyangiaceae bacterium]